MYLVLVTSVEHFLNNINKKINVFHDWQSSFPCQAWSNLRYTTIDCGVSGRNSSLPRRTLSLDQAFPHQNAGVDDAAFQALSRAAAPRVTWPHFLTHLLDYRKQLCILRHPILVFTSRWRRRRCRHSRYCGMTACSIHGIFVHTLPVHRNGRHGDIAQLRLHSLDVHRFHRWKYTRRKENKRSRKNRLTKRETYRATTNKLTREMKHYNYTYNRTINAEINKLYSKIQLM